VSVLQATIVASSSLSGYKRYKNILLPHFLITMGNKPRRPSDLPKAAVEALWHGNVIEAIKVVRQERSIGLKEAKESIDAYIASQPALKKKMEQVLATAHQRFIRWLVGFLVLAAGVTYLVIRGL
jgi:hypothetical protein